MGIIINMVQVTDILKKIKTERKKRKIGQKRLADYLGVERSSYTKKENHQSPLYLDEPFILCDKMSINPASLFADPGNQGYADIARDLLLLVPEKDQQTILQMVEWSVQGVKQRTTGVGGGDIAKESEGD